MVVVVIIATRYVAGSPASVASVVSKSMNKKHVDGNADPLQTSYHHTKNALIKSYSFGPLSNI